MLFKNNVLKAKMVENGDTQERLAEALGINIATMNSKINGRTDFTRQEIEMIGKRYQLSKDDMMNIFFNNLYA